MPTAPSNPYRPDRDADNEGGTGDITFPWEAVCGPGNGDCFEAHEDPGCEDAACCATGFSGFP